MVLSEFLDEFVAWLHSSLSVMVKNPGGKNKKGEFD
jgi:hypothetical protein